MNQQTEENLLDLVKRNYEEIAADFDNSRKKQLWPELLKLAGQVEAGGKVLDVGCGNGRLAGAFLSKDIIYLGVDNSEKLIEAAESNFQSVIARSRQATKQSQVKWHGHGFLSEIAKFIPSDSEGPAFPPVARNDSNIFEFQIADILELDKISENNFNYVFGIAVLHHLPGENLRIKALRQMKNKINSHGKIIITVWNLWPQAKFRKLIFKYGLFKLIGKNKMDLGDILFDWKNGQGQPTSRRYYHAFTRNELKKLAVRAGLKIEKLYKDEYNYYLILRK